MYQIYKKLHVSEPMLLAELNRWKTSASEPRLVLELLLITWKIGPGFFNQSSSDPEDAFIIHESDEFVDRLIGDHPMSISRFSMNENLRTNFEIIS